MILESWAANQSAILQAWSSVCDGGAIQLEEVSFQHFFFCIYEVVRVVGPFVGQELTFSSKKGLFLLVKKVLKQLTKLIISVDCYAFCCSFL